MVALRMDWEVSTADMAGLRKRAFWAIVAAACAASLIVARCLEPDRRGLGTHAQLTSCPCIFRVFTGIPCPTCGMTTSFAHMTRLEVKDAFVVQPFGALLCFCAAVLAPVGAVLALSGAGPRPRVPSEWILGPVLVLLIAGWIYKVLTTRGSW